MELYRVALYCRATANVAAPTSKLTVMLALCRRLRRLDEAPMSRTSLEGAFRSEATLSTKASLSAPPKLETDKAEPERPT